jgi:hypothetical protein
MDLWAVPEVVSAMDLLAVQVAPSTMDLSAVPVASSVMDLLAVPVAESPTLHLAGPVGPRAAAVEQGHETYLVEPEASFLCPMPSPPRMGETLRRTRPTG